LRDRHRMEASHMTALIEAFIEAISEVGGEELGRAIYFFCDLAARTENSNAVPWPRLAHAAEYALSRAKTSAAASWVLAGLAVVPPAHRPDLERFIDDAIGVIRTHKAPSLNVPLLTYLSGVSETDVPILSAGATVGELMEYVHVLVT